MSAPKDFMGFTGITQPDEFRSVTRSHVIAWRDELVKRPLSGRPSVTASLLYFLCLSIICAKETR